MTKQYKCYSNREENKWRIVTLLKPSTVPTFWHVRDVQTGSVFHAAWDMIEEVKREQLAGRVERTNDNRNENDH